MASFFAHNMGPIDRTLRIILGIVLLSMVFFGPRTLLGWVGLLPLVTGLFGSCFVYRMLGVSTRSTENS